MRFPTPDRYLAILACQSLATGVLFELADADAEGRSNVMIVVAADYTTLVLSTERREHSSSLGG
jgi:hypothetical protein